MQVDVIVEPDLAPREIAELGVEAERLGIRALWMSNYAMHWDPFVSLVPVLAATRKLRVGALAVSPFEMHPMRVANALLTVNEIGEGRAMVAIGSGEGTLKAMGIRGPRRIVAAVREAIELVSAAGRRRLGNGYSGEFFNLTQAAALDWVRADPPLVYGTAYRPQMMNMQGRVADGCFIGATPPDAIGTAVANVREGVAARAEPAREFHLNAFWAWHVKAEPEAAYRESRRELLTRARLLDPELIGRYLEPDEVALVRGNFDAIVKAYFERRGDIPEVPTPVLDRLCEAFTSTCALGDLDREIERLRQFRDGGLTEIALRLHDAPMQSLRTIGERVVPAAREWD